MLTDTLAQIEAEAREALALAEKPADGPWYHGVAGPPGAQHSFVADDTVSDSEARLPHTADDAAFMAASRLGWPRSARRELALVAALRAAKQVIIDWGEHEHACHYDSARKWVCMCGLTEAEAEIERILAAAEETKP